MANPPITIGELVDVPAPGSGVKAAFHQEVANRIVHRFATKAALDGWAAADGSQGYVAAGARDYVRAGGIWVFTDHHAAAGRPGVILTDAAQAIATGTVTDITWGTEVSDVDGWTAGGIALLTVPAGWDGRYLISYRGSWATSTALAGCALYINSVPEYTGNDNAQYNTIAVSALRTLAAADTIKATVIHAGGSNRDITSRLEIAWIGR